jgi:hypothetical protein
LHSRSIGPSFPMYFIMIQQSARRKYKQSKPIYQGQGRAKLHHRNQDDEDILNFGWEMAYLLTSGRARI